MSEPLTIDDLLDLRYPAEPQVHPDGSPIVYTVSNAVMEYQQARRTSEIWMTDGGGEARRLTATGTSARHPRWSPDGTSLGFIGCREGQEQEQLFILDVGWGEARRLTDRKGGVRGFSWMPDGKHVALIITDDPPEDEDEAERKESGRDQIEYERHHRLDRVWIGDISGGELTKANDDDLHVWEFAVSPDGRQLAAIVTDEPYDWAWYCSRLVTIDFDTGRVTTVYKPSKQMTRPVWSPDGSRIAVLSCTWSDQGMTGGDVILVDVGGGEQVNVTDGQPRSYVALEWEHSGDGFVAIAVEDGQTAFCRLGLDGTCNVLWKEPVALGIYDAAIFSRDCSGNRLAVVRDDPSHPAEVWTLNLPPDDAGEAVTWTCHSDTNPQVADKQVHPLETHHWRSFDGTTIQGLLMCPAGTDEPARLPMIVLIHGGPTGVTSYDFPSHRTTGWAHLLAGAGYAVLMPNPRGSMGFGTRFAEANLGDMGGGDLEDILAGVDYCIERGIADPDRLGVGGWSYGGYLTAWAVSQTTRFKAAIAGAPITNWTSFHGVSTIPHFDTVFYASDPFNADGVYTFRSPIYHVRKVHTPTLFLHGEQDPTCPPGQSHEMWRALKELGVESELVIYPREGHGPREREHIRDELQRVVSWFSERV